MSYLGICQMTRRQNSEHPDVGVDPEVSALLKAIEQLFKSYDLGKMMMTYKLEVSAAEYTCDTNH